MSHQQLDHNNIAKAILGNSLYIELGSIHSSHNQDCTELDLKSDFLKPILGGESISLDEPSEEQRVSEQENCGARVPAPSIKTAEDIDDIPSRQSVAINRVYSWISRFTSRKTTESMASSVDATTVESLVDPSTDKFKSARFTLAQMAIAGMAPLVLAIVAYSLHLHYRDSTEMKDVGINNKQINAQPSVDGSKPDLKAERVEESTQTDNKVEADASSPAHRESNVSHKDDIASPPISVKVVSGAYVPVEPPRVELPKSIPAPGSQLPLPVEKSGNVKIAAPVVMPTSVGAQQAPVKVSTSNGVNPPLETKDNKPGPLVLDDTSKDDRERAIQKNAPVKVGLQPVSAPVQTQIKSTVQPVKDAQVVETSAKAVSTNKSPGVTVVDVPKDGKSVMVTNPVNRLPMKLVVGERLPNGKVIQSINGAGGFILTADGVTYSMD